MDSRPERTVIVCELQGAVDLCVVEALARLQLVARRRGVRVHVQVLGKELAALLELTGLDPALGQPRREAEAGEERSVVEEVVQVDHPPA